MYCTRCVTLLQVSMVRAVQRLVHCSDIERSPLLPRDDGGQRSVCRFNVLPGSPSIRRRFAALALSSYRGHRAATHRAQHAPRDPSPASGTHLPLLHRHNVCVRVRACVLSCSRLCVLVTGAGPSIRPAGRPHMLPTGVWRPGVSLISSDRRASPASQPAHAHIRPSLPTHGSSLLQQRMIVPDNLKRATSRRSRLHALQVMQPAPVNFFFFL